MSSVRENCTMPYDCGTSIWMMSRSGRMPPKLTRFSMSCVENRFSPVPIGES